MTRLFNVTDALESLGIKEWSLSDVPTTEKEFLTHFSKVVSVDENNHAVFSNDPQTFGVTWNQIQTEMQRLQADYSAKEYQRDRAAEYPSIADQLDTLYHSGLDAWKAQIKTVKDKYPKV
jgi:hypothetical protein